VNLRRTLRQSVRTAVGESGRKYIVRALNAVGLRPRINSGAANSFRHPEGRRASLVISGDLELAWAWYHSRRPSDPLAYARQRARQGRANLGAILALCDQHEIPVTWATVGHLFLEYCSRSNGLTHADLPRIPYFENEYWAYRTGDWFDGDPASTDIADPEWLNWYGPDLLQCIAERPVKHEIGCHSFSHISLTDKDCPEDVAAAELLRCQELAAAVGITLRSLVFPGNLAGNFGSVHRAGFKAYRWHGPYDLDVPSRDEFGLWRIPGGVCVDRPNRTWTAADCMAIVRAYIDHAIDYSLVGGLWFHPETNPHDVEEVFPAVLEHVASRRSDIWVGTVGDLALWLDAQAAA
jgi:peptidoglycan/xylan/chitin deacetylase (PgdA/CDA1 family)